MRRALQLAALAVAIAGALPAQQKRIYVDPASRWISMHDQAGDGAALEFTRDLQKACPEVVPTDRRESADYAVSIARSGMSGGSVVIYAGGSVALSFRPGHTATLRKVAERVCGFVKEGK